MTDEELPAISPEDAELQAQIEGDEEGFIPADEIVSPAAKSVGAEGILPVEMDVPEPMAESDVDEAEISSEEAVFDFNRKFSAYYYALLYGPPVKNPTSSLHPQPNGKLDPSKRVQLRNYIGLTYHLNEKIGITPTAFWTVQAGPVKNFAIQDPFVRVSYNSILSSEWFNWYGDVRFHLPISTGSRENDLLAGVQTFHAFSYLFGESGFNAAIYTGVRLNSFGKYGYGNDVEVYFAPFAAYQLTDNLALSLLYEMGASHGFGDPLGKIYSDGTNVQPGVIWDITPSLSFNPYLNFYPADGFNLRSTSLGMTLSWTFI